MGRLSPNDIDLVIEMLPQQNMATVHQALTEMRDDLRKAREEIDVDDQLIANSDHVLAALPCPIHGRCVPYALEQIAKLKAKA